MKNKCDFCGKEFVGNGIVIVSFPGASDLDFAELLCSEECKEKAYIRSKELSSLFT